MKVKERLIRLIQSLASESPVSRRKLILSFNKSRRAEARIALSGLLSEGYVNPLGTGRRGSPLRIVMSATWRADRCPLCGR